VGIGDEVALGVEVVQGKDHGAGEADGRRGWVTWIGTLRRGALMEVFTSKKPRQALYAA
jgi:hypothetical protein